MGWHVWGGVDTVTATGGARRSHKKKRACQGPWNDPPQPWHTGLSKRGSTWTGVRGDRGNPPPPLSQHRDRVLVQGGNVRAHGGSPCLDRPGSPRGTPHGTHVADMSHLPPPQNMTIQSNTPAHTPQHKSTRNYTHTNALPPHTDPSCGPAQRYTPPSRLEWKRKKMVPKNAQKCGNTGYPCLDRPMFGQREGGVTFLAAPQELAVSWLWYTNQCTAPPPNGMK